VAKRGAFEDAATGRRLALSRQREWQRCDIFPQEEGAFTPCRQIGGKSQVTAAVRTVGLEITFIGATSGGGVAKTRDLLKFGVAPVLILKLGREA